MRCPQCGKTTPFVTGSFCDTCGALLSSEYKTTPTGLVPSPKPVVETVLLWESDQRKKAPLITLYTTFRAIIFNPDRFFRNAVSLRPTSILPAIIYGLITGSIGTIASCGWNEIFAKYGETFTDYTTLFGSTFTSPSMLIASPLLLLTKFLLLAVYTRCIIRISRCQRRVTIGDLIRILCYAESASIIQLLPIVGSFGSMIISFYIILTGFHHLFGVRRIKILVLLLLPPIIITTLLVIIIIAGVSGGMIAGAGFLQNWQSILR